MSYVFGFVVADGCVVKRRGRMDSYIFNITSKDREHLFRIRKALKSDYPISEKNNSQGKVYYQIQITNIKVCKDLMKLGILPRKTHNLGRLEIPNKYFPDFVRGFFDGDGTVYIYKVNGVWQIKAEFVSSSSSFIEGFNQQLCAYLDIPQKSVHKFKPKDRMTQYNICFYVDDCRKLEKLIYKNSSCLCLERKYKIFKKWNLVKRRHYMKINYPSKVGLDYKYAT